jgi:hypothetical protein
MGRMMHDMGCPKKPNHVVLPVKPIITEIIGKLAQQPYIPGIPKRFPTKYVGTNPIYYRVKNIIYKGKNNNSRNRFKQSGKHSRAQPYAKAGSKILPVIKTFSGCKFTIAEFEEY